MGDFKWIKIATDIFDNDFPFSCLWQQKNIGAPRLKSADFLNILKSCFEYYF